MSNQPAVTLLRDPPFDDLGRAYRCDSCGDGPHAETWIDDLDANGERRVGARIREHLLR